MSAFQVPQAHAGAIVRFYMEHTRDFHTPSDDEAQQMIATLIAECDRSVITRYARHPIDPTPIDRRSLLSYRQLSPVQCLKALACLEYQSCETDDYQTTPAYRVLLRIRDTAIFALPGFSDADVWPIGE